MQERRIDDYWNIDGSRDLSGSWTGFAQFTLLDEKPPDGYMSSGERLTKRQATSRPDHLWPELWTKLGRNAKLREKQKWSIEKPKLDNARRLRGIYFIDPEDKEFKETIRNDRKKLETPMAPAMPCKTSKKSKHEKPVARPMIPNQNLGVSWKPVNPQDCVWKNLYQIIMRSILQERVTIHYNITIWYTNLFLCFKPWRYPQQEQQWIQSVRNLKRFRRGTWQKSCKQYTSHVTFFSFTARTCNVWYHIGSSVGARHPIHVSCAWVIVGSLFDPHFALFRVFLYLPLLLPEPWLPPFPLPCGCLRSKIPCALRPMRSLALCSIIYLPQVMSPTSSMISTTQRSLKSSFRSNPETRCPRTCMTRRSVTTPSAERSLHHFSFRSEKNQRAVDKLTTLLKKVCCQVSPCLSVM